jgi:hypothetical protein
VLEGKPEDIKKAYKYNTSTRALVAPHVAIHTKNNIYGYCAGFHSRYRSTENKSTLNHKEISSIEVNLQLLKWYGHKVIQRNRP